MRTWWLSPGDPGQRTGGYLWNVRIADGLRARGHDVRVVPVSGRWPLPGVDDGGPIAAIPDGELVVADGLLWPGLGALGAALARRCPVVVIVHSLLAHETGARDPEALDALERRALRDVALRVATSEVTARGLGAALPAVVVVPGTAPAPISSGSDGRTVLTVGTLTRRKGHDRLLDALATVDGPWTLLCAGGARDAAWADVLRARVEAAGWAERVVWLGELDDAGLQQAWARADLVVQPARYEAFGMAIAEAVARGLPVITFPAGAVDHLPPGAVRVVQSDDALSEALRGWLADPAARATQAARARAAASSLPTWQDQADRLAVHLQRAWEAPHEHVPG